MNSYRDRPAPWQRFIFRSVRALASWMFMLGLYTLLIVGVLPSVIHAIAARLQDQPGSLQYTLLSARAGLRRDAQRDSGQRRARAGSAQGAERVLA